MVEALQRLMATGDDVTGPVNLGNPEEITIHDLAQKIIDLLGSPSLLTYHSLPEDDPVQRQPDITLAQKILNWQPRVKLNEGLRLTADYFSTLQENLPHGLQDNVKETREFISKSNQEVVRSTPITKF